MLTASAVAYEQSEHCPIRLRAWDDSQAIGSGPPRGLTRLRCKVIAYMVCGIGERGFEGVMPGCGARRLEMKRCGCGRAMARRAMARLAMARRAMARRAIGARWHRRCDGTVSDDAGRGGAAAGVVCGTGERSNFDGAMAGCGARWLGIRRCGRGRAMDRRAMVSGAMTVGAMSGRA